MKFPRPVRAWAIAHESGEYAFFVGSMPELFAKRGYAESQNIDRMNGGRVIRVEIRAVRANNKRRKRAK